ncbi:Acetylcholine receptor subunit alpha-like 1 [Hypsibius exemplaris]|uniref:Acetylcholine receptor subunit alpha-like 1 n=1 Tax=Hypsibius exemplaris TaxID=2072580 RepID=A0A9X6NGP9_HYPEX|nr:Acetylcholine receptor subunit alpha-like 1 [Hypsibius exemplaris]
MGKSGAPECFLWLTGLLLTTTQVGHYWVEGQQNHAEALHTFLMETYPKYVRPVEVNEKALDVSLELKLMQLIGVDEVNQVITVNVEVKQVWLDYKLKWEPELFGGMTQINLPCESIWLPDVVLYDNAEGDYQITKMTTLTVNNSGFVTWNPPAIYKSYCKINVHNFPYDKQNCTMKFGSWTFDASLVDLKPSRDYLGDSMVIKKGMDLSEYKPSIEWDILEVSAMRNKLVIPYGTYVDITFRLVIRRKTLFYTVNLMIPCVLISFLTIFVFYLPCDSGEKVTLCISILLSLTVSFFYWLRKFRRLQTK